MQTHAAPIEHGSPSDTTLGERLARLRRAAGLTQEQVGVGLGADGRDLGKGAVSCWEQNVSQPSARQVRQLCERLGVSADYLLGLLPEGDDRKAA